MYIHEHSIGSILRSTFKIYGGSFFTIVTTYTLPVLPCAILIQEAAAAHDTELLIAGMVANMIVVIFAYGAMTVTVSDICLGNRPGLLRSYRRLFGKMFFGYLYSNLLQMLAIISVIWLFFFLLNVSGLGKMESGLAAAVSGMVVMIWFMFVPLVVILERTTGVGALKRSKSLGNGFHWKNAATILLLIAIVGVVGGLVGGVFGFLFPESPDHWVHRTVRTILQEGLSMPIVLTALVLMYYNLRVRKEGFDSEVLAEELKH